MVAIPADRPRLITRRLGLLFLATFAALTSFYLLLAVVPLYATALGAGGVGAGLTTGALMLATVAAELGTPRLIGRFGARATLLVGMALLGLPALALPAAPGLPAILANSLVRGVGFAIAVVVGGALVADLVPTARLGEGIGLYGAVASVPSIIALPAGVWCADRFGYTPVFVAAAATAVAGMAAVLGLPGRVHHDEDPVRMSAALRSPALLRPAIAFGATAMAAGVIVTFLPSSLGSGSAALAAVALFVQSVAGTATRWWAGRRADRYGPDRMLWPAIATAAAGVLGLALVPNPALLLVSVLLFGAGFGAAQSASLTQMFNRVPAGGNGAVSALWNLAFDAGIGLGATGFGVLVGRAGGPAAYAVTAAALAAASLLAVARRPAPAGA